MADNVIADSGDSGGATFATDDIGSVHYPLTKIALGALDANDGPVGTGNPMPVELTDDNQTVVADIGSIKTSVELLDNAVDGAYLNTNANIAGTDIVGGEGVIAAGVQRVTIATDDDGVAHLATIAGDTTSLDGKVTACNTGAVVLAAGTANIGDVDLELAGTAVSANTGVLDAGTIRVAIATDDPVNDLLTTIDADTSSMNTDLGTVAGAVTGSEMQVDVVAALPAGTNAIGKLAANSGVDIGDVDVTSLPGAIQGPADPSIDSYTQAVLSENAGADNVVIAAPGASKQIWVYGIVFTCDTAATSVTFQDEDDTAISGTMLFAQYGGLSHSPAGNFSMPLWKVPTNKALEVDLVTGDIDGWISYGIVSV